MQTRSCLVVLGAVLCLGLPPCAPGQRQFEELRIKDYFPFDGDNTVALAMGDVLQRTETVETGNIIVALVDNEEVTLKRFRRRGKSIALEPANKAFETRIFPPERVKVQGRLIGLIRTY